MTWAEFQIKAIAFKRQKKHTHYLFREIAYEVHCTNYIFSKKKPPKKNDYWKIDERGISRADKEAFLTEVAKYYGTNRTRG